MTRPTSAAALLCSLALLPACSGVVAPRFEAVGVRTGERTDEGLVLLFDLEATNDNPEPMQLQTAEYTLSIAGEPVFTGIRSPEATIRRFGTQRIELPAVIPFSAAIPEGSPEYRITGSVSYLEPGRLAEVLFDADVRVPKAPLAVGGVIEFGE